MKKREYLSKLKWVAVSALMWILVLEFLLVFALCFPMIGEWLQNQRIWIMLFLLIVDFAMAAVSIHVVFSNIKRMRNLCQRFITGEVYNEFLESMGEMDRQLAGAFHRMDGLLNRQNTIKLATKQAEFLALQNQINPHFLYNTLDAIRSDALSFGSEEIADITEALSTFFQYTITDTRHLVPLQRELESVYNYFLIQKYRFDEKLSLEVQLKDDPQELKQMLCPKLMLQPIVENAIFHGLEMVTENGKIRISVEIVDDTLRIEVSDNGAGMDEETLKALNDRLARNSVGTIVEEPQEKESGIALLNVCRRIKLLFGEQYGIHLNSIQGTGTLVEISLPTKLSEEI